MLGLIAFGFFCALALGQPDSSLIASDATIDLPFANTKISFVAFLLIGPLVLAAFFFYLHIFVGYWTELSSRRPTVSNGSSAAPPSLPFVFNLRGRAAAVLSWFLFYGLVPSVLAAFAWKALPRPEAPLLILLCGTSVIVSVFLRMRRQADRENRMWSDVRWIALVYVAYLTFLLASAPSIGRPLHLRKADLSEQDLRFLKAADADLTEADLVGANLYAANLRGSRLFRAKLDAAQLQEADLYRANLRAAHLVGADLTAAHLRTADLFGGYLEAADLPGADLFGAHLRGAHLIRAHLKAADLSDTDLIYADLTDADFTGADLSGASLTGAKGLRQEQINSACVKAGYPPPKLDSLKPPPITDVCPHT